jgi:hypothetical protein
MNKTIINIAVNTFLCILIPFPLDDGH